MIAHAPSPPAWRLDFDRLDAAYAWVRRMRGCPQAPDFHGEGDVWIHTRMVMEAMLDAEGFQALPEADRHRLLAAALLHDVAKPHCTRWEDGRWTSRGHARRGAVVARRLMWEMGVDFVEREAVAALVEAHPLPFWWMERERPARLAHAFSQRARCADLVRLAEADARGRIADDIARLLESIGLFGELCRDEGCLEGPRAFASDHSRFTYFRSEARDPDYAAHDDTRCEVIVMSGLPGAGKDTWIRAHCPDLPMVSLDALRGELGVSPSAPQGPVVQAARERAREHLRAARSFVWNATNLSRDVRGRCIDLCTDYGARVRVVYVEAPPRVQAERNERRPHAVPPDAIERMLDHWEVPDLTEAHAVEVVLG